jgi:hypothetical protein
VSTPSPERAPYAEAGERRVHRAWEAARGIAEIERRRT